MAILTNKGTQFTSIQNAINALPNTGGVIYIGPGTYVLPTTRVTVKSNVILQGSGKGVTVIQAPDAFGAAIGTDPVHGENGEFMFVNTSSGENHAAYSTFDDYITIKDLTLDGNGANQTRRVGGIGFQYVDNLTVENVEYINFGTLNLLPETNNTEALGDKSSYGFLFKNCTRINTDGNLNATNGGAFIMCKYVNSDLLSENGTGKGVYLSDVQNGSIRALSRRNEYSNFYMASDYSGSGGLGNLDVVIELQADTTMKQAGYTTWLCPGAYVAGGSKITVSLCDIKNSKGDGLLMSGISYSNVQLNNIYNNNQLQTTAYGIRMLSVTNTLVENNELFDDQVVHTQLVQTFQDGGSSGNNVADYVTLAGTQTLTNKTLTTPVIPLIYQDVAKTKLMTLPNTTSDTLVGVDAIQNLTNKTLTTPTLLLANGSPSANGSAGYNQSTKRLVIGDGSTSQNIGLGAWVAYTPSLTNITLGNGTLEFKYNQLGKTTYVSGHFKMGTTSSVSGLMTFSPPFEAISQPQYVSTIATIIDAGTAFIPAVVRVIATQIQIAAINTAGTYATNPDTSATIPMTWTTNDELFFVLTYEAK